MILSGVGVVFVSEMAVDLSRMLSRILFREGDLSLAIQMSCCDCNEATPRSRNSKVLLEFFGLGKSIHR